jgi:gamma-polyglutamate biosynthesis protein CapA
MEPIEGNETVLIETKKRLCPIRIAAVGDIMLGDHPVRLGHGVRSSIEKAGAEFLFSGAQKLWEGCDIVFGNLEAIISDKGLEMERIESREFRGAPISIRGLQKAGFTVLNIANNHCMEHGEDAFRETVRVLQSYDIFVAGIKGDDGRCIPYEIEKDGQRAILLAYSLRPENYFTRRDVPYCLCIEELIVSEVAHHSRTGDAVIVSLHWGEEFMRYPSPKQVELGHRIIDAGARLVIGHHPHTLQGVETYKRGVIVYSLGNFVFDMYQRATRKTMVFSVTLQKRHAPAFELVPFLIGKGFCPERLDGLLAQQMKSEIEELCRVICKKYDGIEKLGDGVVDKIERDYQRIAKKAYLRHRIGNYLYFFVHLYRYEFLVILQSLRRSFLRRLQEARRRQGL